MNMVAKTNEKRLKVLAYPSGTVIFLSNKPICLTMHTTITLRTHQAGLIKDPQYYTWSPSPFHNFLPLYRVLYTE